jgi:(2Fe-2S) ferredoxin
VSGVDPSTRVERHLLLCATPTKPRCSDPSVGAASWERLKSLLRQLDLENPARPVGVVWRTKADCLRVCRDGPILLVWPDGITYGGVTPQRVERIVRQHLIDGEPVREWILQRCAFSSPEPPASGP